jgi:hypothetical protein
MTIPKSSDTLAVLDAFLSLGYCELKGAFALSNNEKWYVDVRAVGDVHHVALVEYKRGQDAYSIQLGGSCEKAILALRNARQLIDRHINPLLRTAAWGLWRRPCWTMLDAGRALDWTLLAIPDPISRGRWPEQLAALQTEVLEPLFWRITSAEQLRNMLMRTDGAYGWIGSNALLRVAEIIALSKVAGESESEIVQSLAPFYDYLERDVVGSDGCAALISGLVREIH